jgi:hypothetical protein
VDNRENGGRVPPMPPFPKARRGHPEEPMMTTRSAATRTWLAIGAVLVLLVLLFLVLVAVAVAIAVGQYFGEGA